MKFTLRDAAGSVICAVGLVAMIYAFAYLAAWLEPVYRVIYRR